jgi:hypothetical protein
LNELEVDDALALNIGDVKDLCADPFLLLFQLSSGSTEAGCFILSPFSAAIFLANAMIPGTIEIWEQ